MARTSGNESISDIHEIPNEGEDTYRYNMSEENLDKIQREDDINYHSYKSVNTDLRNHLIVDTSFNKNICSKEHLKDRRKQEYEGDENEPKQESEDTGSKMEEEIGENESTDGQEIDSDGVQQLPRDINTNQRSEHYPIRSGERNNQNSFQETTIKAKE